MTRAVLYLRVSTEKQAERDLSIPNQRRQIEAFCLREGLTVVAEYQDAGLSARSSRRPEFQRMISDAKKKPRPFDEVVVYNWSRFFRDATEALFYIRELDRLGVKVRAVTQDVTDDASGRLLRTILAATDEHASEMIGERTLGGMEENVRRGYVNGIAPYGFKSAVVGQHGDKIKKKFEPDPKESQTVQKIFGLYLHGDGITGPLGVKKIVEYLNVNGYRQRQGKVFNVKFVHTIMHNTACAGVYVWNKTDSRSRKTKPESEWIRVEVPSLVSQEIFDATQRQLFANQPRRTPARRVNTPILLSGLIVCGHCGKAMTRGAGKDERYRYYMCSSKNRAGSVVCKGQWLPMAAVDETLVEGFIERILNPDRLIEVIRQVETEVRSTAETGSGAKRALEAELRSAQKELDTLISAVARGVLDDDDAKGQIAQRKAAISDIRRRLEQAEPKPLISLHGLTEGKIRWFGSAIANLLRTGDIKFRQAYLRLFIDRIEVKDGELAVTGTREALAEAANMGNSLAETGVHALVHEWRPHGDSNPGYRRERAMS